MIYALILEPSEGAELINDPPLRKTCRQIRLEMLKPHITAVKKAWDDLKRENHHVQARAQHSLDNFDAIPVDQVVKRVDEEVSEMKRLKDALSLVTQKVDRFSCEIERLTAAMALASGQKVRDGEVKNVT